MTTMEGVGNNIFWRYICSGCEEKRWVFVEGSSEREEYGEGEDLVGRGFTWCGIEIMIVKNIGNDILRRYIYSSIDKAVL